MSSSDVDFAELDAAAAKILEIAEQALLRGETEDIPDETVQRLLTAGTRLFAREQQWPWVCLLDCDPLLYFTTANADIVFIMPSSSN